MICCQVFGNDVAINCGGASGNFELNVYWPLAGPQLPAERASADRWYDQFRIYCARGIEANPVQIEPMLAGSLMLVTALIPHIGYDRAAEIARLALREGTTLKQATLKLGHVSEGEFERWVQPANMVSPSPD